MRTTDFQPLLLERLNHLDVLRGFALFGVFLVNFQWFTRPMQAIVLGAEPGLDGANLVVDVAIKSLAEGKFYALFSMLFGAGFALMYERASRAGASFWPVYLRRLALLAIIGLPHVVLIWPGDILLVYALCAGVMVLLFRRTPESRLWKWALLLIFLPLLLLAMGAAAISAAQMAPDGGAEMLRQFAEGERVAKEAMAAAAATYQNGSFTDAAMQRLADLGFSLSNALFWVPPVLGYFLLGRWLLASGRLSDPAAHASWYRRWRVGGLVAGIALSVAGAWQLHDLNIAFPNLQLAQATALFASGALLLALGLLCTVVLASRSLCWLAPVGRMALSNYLLQSLFWTTVFYGYGLGMWGEIPRAMQPICVAVFFALQVALSHWWLSRFRFGPAEWLWRSLTYLRVQPFRRSVGKGGGGS